MVQSLIVPSSDPEASTLPSGEKATEMTGALCPSRVKMHFPLSTSQSFIVSSWEPEARRSPIGEKATEFTPLLFAIDAKVVGSDP